MSGFPMSGLPMQVGSTNAQLRFSPGESGSGLRGTAVLQRGLGAQPSPSDVEAQVFIRSNFLKPAEGAQSSAAQSQPTEPLQGPPPEAQHAERPRPEASRQGMPPKTQDFERPQPEAQAARSSGPQVHAEVSRRTPRVETTNAEAQRPEAQQGESSRSTTNAEAQRPEAQQGESSSSTTNAEAQRPEAQRPEGQRPEGQRPGTADREPHNPARPESPAAQPNNGPNAGAPGASRDAVHSAPQRENTAPVGQRPARSERTTNADTTNSTGGHEDLNAVGRGGYKVNSRGIEAGIGLPMAEGDFWGRVVTAQNALQGHPHCPPGQALGLAIAWAVAASGLEPALMTRGPMPKVAGVSASTPGSVAARSSSTSAAGETDLEEWVGQLHTDLSARASRALITAWQQRGSALRAVTYDRG